MNLDFINFVKRNILLETSLFSYEIKVVSITIENNKLKGDIADGEWYITGAQDQNNAQGEFEFGKNYLNGRKFNFENNEADFEYEGHGQTLVLTLQKVRVSLQDAEFQAMGEMEKGDNGIQIWVGEETSSQNYELHNSNICDLMALVYWKPTDEEIALDLRNKVKYSVYNFSKGYEDYSINHLEFKRIEPLKFQGKSYSESENENLACLKFFFTFVKDDNGEWIKKRGAESPLTDYNITQ